MSSNNTVVVRFVDIITHTVKYEYNGKRHQTNSLRTLVERARAAGIIVRYTEPVQRYLASLRSPEQAAPATEPVHRFDWTTLKGVGPITCQRLWAHGINSFVDAYSATDAELWEATHNKVVFEDVRAYASRMWCS